ncbi:MAG: TraR/DksA C4-type zinc finger protein [Frankiaceae bacterium]|jgi:RNA polymerase-binding transcription factor DksA|nr:TraR/DksA C4-type zinc finger protein [Frankiaceae bacterium]
MTASRTVGASDAEKAPARAGAPIRGHTADRGPSGAARASGWSEAELAEVRAALDAELSAMDCEYARSLAELEQMHSGACAGSGDDQADAGAAAFEREQELSIVVNRRDLLDQMQRAIARIDSGAYGWCECCGQPIPKARLRAFPAATLDVACKAREERR